MILEQFQNLMTKAATPHERVVLSLVQDGKSRGSTEVLALLLACKCDHAGIVVTRGIYRFW